MAGVGQHDGIIETPHHNLCLRNQILKTLSETQWRIEEKDGAAAIPGLYLP